MNKEGLNAILDSHLKWLNDQGGERANLRGADLWRANLGEANLWGAELREADLREADLRGANLWGADLWGADLREAELREAELREADLWRADLREADLWRADLREADLREADLREADLRRASLRGAKLLGAKLPHFQICPEVGAFRAFKKTDKGVIEIEIPADARRTSSLVGRKCRAEFVLVIGGEGVGGYDRHSGETLYPKGEVVMPDSYDDDIRIECTHGIHFFMTKAEAEEWK